MSFADKYLDRQHFTGITKSPPHPDLRYIVVIPCFFEPLLADTLNSLWSCKQPKGAVEVLVVINAPVDAPDKEIEQNKQTLASVKEWAESHSRSRFRTFTTSELLLPEKYAGPGLARKIGMDEAVYRFSRLDRPDGVILSLDADCTVKANYFTEIERQFKQAPDTKACSIRFEHVDRGPAFDPQTLEATLAYELHLRYYIQAVRNTGFPHAYHTIGSCFCVKAETYVKQGGMNKRKGGEDFYFLQKIIPLGNFHEINKTCVYPVARLSDRVPFGTGIAVWKNILYGKEQMTFHPESFPALAVLFSKPEQLFRAGHETVNAYLEALPDHIKLFLRDEFESRIAEINANTAYPESFRRRFFLWFNMFKILKYLNFAHEGHFDKQPVNQAADALLRDMGTFKAPATPEKPDTAELLAVYRKIQRRPQGFGS